MIPDNYIEVNTVVQEEPVFLIDRAHFSIKLSGLVIQCLVDTTRWINYMHSYRIQSGHPLLVKGRLFNLEEAIRQNVRPSLIVTSLQSIQREVQKRPSRQDVPLLSGYLSDVNFNGEPEDAMSITTNVTTTSNKKRRMDDEPEVLKRQKAAKMNDWVEFRESIADYIMMLFGRIKYVEARIGSPQSENLVMMLKQLDQLYPNTTHLQESQEFAVIAANLIEKLRRAFESTEQPMQPSVPLPSLVYHKILSQ